MKLTSILFTWSLHQNPTNLAVFILSLLQTSYNVKLEIEMISGAPLKQTGPSWRRTGVISPYLLRKQGGVDLMCNWWAFVAGRRCETAPLICSYVCAVESFTAQKSFSRALRSEASAAISASVLHLEGTSSSSRSCFCNCKKKRKKKETKYWQKAVTVIYSLSIGATWHCYSAPHHSDFLSCTARATPEGGPVCRGLLFLFYFP